MADEAQAKEEKKDPKTEAAPGEGAPPAEGDDAAAAGRAKKRKLMIMASAAVAVVGIAVAVGVVFFMGDDKKKVEEHPKDETTVEVSVVDVPEFTINLLGEDENAGHFMKIKLAVELAHKTDTANVNALLPRLQDDWNVFLRQMRPGDMQGSAALQRLKEGLMRRATQSLAPVPVKAVYIRELIVQ